MTIEDHASGYRVTIIDPVVADRIRMHADFDDAGRAEHTLERVLTRAFGAKDGAWQLTEAHLGVHAFSRNDNHLSCLLTFNPAASGLVGRWADEAHRSEPDCVTDIIDRCLVDHFLQPTGVRSTGVVVISPVESLGL